MRLAVLASPESWYARDLARAAGADHEIVTLPFSEIRRPFSRSPTPDPRPPHSDL